MKTPPLICAKCCKWGPRQTSMIMNTQKNIENGLDDHDDISNLYKNLGDYNTTIFELQAHVVTTRGYLTIEGHRRLGKAYKRILVSHIENVQHVIQGRTGIYGSQFDIEKEICRIYAEYVGTVYKRLLPAQKTDEELVYCWKIIAVFNLLVWACFRHTPDDHAHGHLDAAERAYELAYEKAIRALSAINPLRLAVSCSYAKCLADALTRPDMSRRILERAVRDADAYIGGNPDEILSPDSRKKFEKLQKRYGNLSC